MISFCQGEFQSNKAVARAHYLGERRRPVQHCIMHYTVLVANLLFVWGMSGVCTVM